MISNSIVINGKFYNAALEGMPRVGREITAAIDALLSEPAWSAIDVTLCVPRGTTGCEGLTRIRTQEVGKRTGFLWEQIDLPRFAARRTILSFTSTGPVIASNAATIVHDAQQYSTPKSFHWKNKILYKTITPLICRRHGLIFTVSNYAKQEITSFDLCEPGKIHVIHNGADHILRTIRDDSIIDRLNLVSNKYILCNSYIHAHKNIRIIFEALRHYPDISRRLVLFGTSMQRDYEAQGMSIPAGVQFTGRVTDGELRSLYENACMFLFPSKTEGFGLPPLEAMALGCPAVVARAGAMPEVCADGALYANPDRPEEWLSAIASIMTDEGKRRARSIIGRQRAMRFTWRRSAIRYLALLTGRDGPSALGGRPQASPLSA